jgi:hydroxymethylbilane synthase
MSREERVITVGTRQSALALTQTGQVIDQLEAICEEHGLPYTFEIRKILTKGDQILDVTLSKVGGKGLFVKEIEQALIDKEIDLAVHSMKDMPYELPEGLINGATPKRVHPGDCLIMKKGNSLQDLPLGAKVGTSSLRRSCQLKHARPDLQLESIRGNIDSRIRPRRSRLVKNGLGGSNLRPCSDGYLHAGGRARRSWHRMPGRRFRRQGAAESL